MVDIKTALIILLSVAVIILSTCKSCKISSLEKELIECKSANHPEMLLVPDRSTVSQIPYRDTILKYIPKLIATSYDPPVYLIDSIIRETKYLSVDTQAILRDYFVTRFYSDTIKGKYGNIAINDSVSQNKIISRTPIWNLSIPEKTTYVTKYIRKGVLYAGIDAYSDINGNINGAGASLMWQSSKALNYEFGAYYNNILQLRASIKFPLTKK